MIRIAKISLDVRKDAVINNEPIILRQGENDVTIEATILNGGDETLQINFATFVAKKPDGTIVSNDPANVNGSVISYSVSKHLTESVGKIQDAYFVINNEVTTNGFDISIIPSTQLDDTSVSYIPGIENINKFLTDTENDWLGRIQQMKSQIAGLDIPAEFKLLMNKSLDEAKAQYQPTIDAAEANVENIVADLAAKKLDLETNSDELNATIVAIKAQIASVNSFLDGVQKQIIEANASFTAGQQAQVSQSISDGQKKLTDSIASMQTKFESDSKDLKSQSDQVIADLKSSSDTAIKDMQENQSTAMAKVNQDISNANISIKQLQESAVSKASPLSSVDKPQLTKDANWDDYANSGVYLVQGASGGNNIPIGAGTTWGYLMVLNGSPSGGAVQIYYDCVDTPVALYMRGTRGTPLVWSSWIKLTTLDSLNGKTITGKDSAGKDISIKITGIS